jgi:hypothetical protein
MKRNAHTLLVSIALTLPVIGYGASETEIRVSKPITSVVSDVPAGPDAEAGLLTVDTRRNKAFRIKSSGKVDQIFPPPRESKSAKWVAISELMVSPGQQRIAYSQNHNLWVYDMVAKKRYQLTHVGRPYTKTLASIEIMIKQWSWDEGKILYMVARNTRNKGSGLVSCMTEV